MTENKIASVSIAQSKKLTMTQKLLKLKRNLLIIIMINMLLLQNLIFQPDAFNARLAQANLITKTDFDAKLSSLSRKITANKTKHVLKTN